MGDGLVSQIPALITATAAGMLVTKSSTQIGLGTEIGAPVFDETSPAPDRSRIARLFAMAPGMPMIPFLLMSIGLWVTARRIPQAGERIEKATSEQSATPVSPMEEHLSEFLESDRACVEIGGRLLGLVDPPRAG